MSCGDGRVGGVGRLLARRQNIEATGDDVRACSAAAVARRGGDGLGYYRAETEAPPTAGVRSYHGPADNISALSPRGGVGMIRAGAGREPPAVASPGSPPSVLTTSMFPCLIISFTCAVLCQLPSADHSRPRSRCESGRRVTAKTNLRYVGSEGASRFRFKSVVCFRKSSDKICLDKRASIFAFPCRARRSAE